MGAKPRLQTLPVEVVIAGKDVDDIIILKVLLTNEAVFGGLLDPLRGNQSLDIRWKSLVPVLLRQQLAFLSVQVEDELQVLFPPVFPDEPHRLRPEMLVELVDDLVQFAGGTRTLLVDELPLRLLIHIIKIIRRTPRDK